MEEYLVDKKIKITGTYSSYRCSKNYLWNLMVHKIDQYLSKVNGRADLLDAACSRGNTCQFFNRQRINYFGIDADYGRLSDFNQRTASELYYGSLLTPIKINKVFDIIVSTRTFSHFIVNPINHDYVTYEDNKLPELSSLTNLNNEKLSSLQAMLKKKKINKSIQELRTIEVANHKWIKAKYFEEMNQAIENLYHLNKQGGMMFLDIPVCQNLEQIVKYLSPKYERLELIFFENIEHKILEECGFIKKDSVQDWTIKEMNLPNSPQQHLFCAVICYHKLAASEVETEIEMKKSVNRYGLTINHLDNF